MRIQFWKPSEGSSTPTWLVFIESDWYEMNESAMQPNGVNMYVGEEESVDRQWISGSMEAVDYVNLVPVQIVKATLQRVADYY